MKIIEFIILTVVLLLAIESRAATVEINQRSDRLPLGKHSDYLIDANQQLTIAQISDMASQLNWTAANGQHPNFGYSTQRYWFRLSLKNTSPATIDKLASLSSYMPLSVSIYSREAGQLKTKVESAGLSSHFLNRPIEHNHIVLRLVIPAGETVELFYSFQALSTSSFDLQLHDVNKFLVYDKQQSIAYGIGYGIFLIIAMSCLLILFISRNYNFLYFAIFSLSIAITQTIQIGHLYQWLPASGRSITLIWYTVCVTFLLSLTLFTIRFNNMKVLMPRAHNFSLFIVSITTAAICTGYATGNDSIATVASFAYIGVMLMLLLFSFACFYRGNASSIYFSLGMLFLALSIGADTLRALGVFDTQNDLIYLMMLGAIGMVITFSIGLGVQYNALRRESSRLLVEREIKKLKTKKAELDVERTNEFLATMSHEIRTPINGVLGMSEILSLTDLTEKQRYYNRMVMSSGKTLLAIINDILDFSKLQSKKLHLEAIPFSLDEMFANTLSIYSVQAEKKSIRLIGFYQPHVPVNLIGDPYRLQQIINNLISNAIKFTDIGTVDLIIGGKSIDSSVFELMMRVEDTGVGISEEQIGNLFEAFEQGDTSTSRQYGGTGLGLTISKQLVDLMNGAISVQSSEGNGSQFTVTVPIKIDQELESARINALQPLKGSRLLMIDNFPAYRDRISRIFEYFETHVSMADTLCNAVEKVKAMPEAPDVILLSPSGIVDLNVSNLRDLMQLSIPIVSIPGKGLSKDVREILSGMSQSISSSPTFSQMLRSVSEAASGSGTDNSEEATKKSLPSYKDINLLIVEDNLINQQVITSMAGKLGIKFSIAANGLEALELVADESNHYCGILMDCEMPEMDGYSATAEIRRYERASERPRLPIVALTAHALPEFRQKCMESGMDDMLVKPVNLQSLMQVVDKWFVQ